ncbi:MAG: hypothetical protein HY336_02345 [Candidatus Doudnabacteria bacterium]|nr:hypothetical protein [Candidatus Doudnabacteria bacterium]
MKKGKLIVIDGTDGSGKATQSRLLFKNLQKQRIKTAILDFPVYDSLTGRLITRYLKNEFGRLNPYLASMLYAANRFQFRDKILQWLREGRVVILNRYVTANQIHQAAHLKTKKERNKFVNWIGGLEYDIFGLPRPDLVILINMPVDIANRLIQTKSAINRVRVAGSKGDMLESDLEHQKEALRQAIKISQSSKIWRKIDAVERGKLLSKEEINKKIFSIVSRFMAEK